MTKKHENKPVLEGATISEPFKKSKHRVSFGPFVKRNKTAVLLLVLLLVGGSALGYFVYRNNQPKEEKSFGTPLPTTEAGVKKAYQEAKQKAPAASAPNSEKLRYYQNLEFLAASAGDYASAVSAFEQREKIDASKLQYNDYYDAAQYYDNSGNKQKALAMLDKAEAILPKQDNVDLGYIRQDVLKKIQDLRQEYMK